MNLVEALQDENRKGRDFLKELESLEALGPGPKVSRQITHSLIDLTEKALSSGDVLEMLKAASANGIGGDS